MNNSLRRIAAISCLCCASLLLAQEIDVNELPRPEFQGMTQKQMASLIFSKEEAMLERLGSLPLMTEAYVQSLGHRKYQGMDWSLDEQSDTVIDDLYFLGRINLGEDGPEEKLLIGGGSWRNRYIKINSGALDQVHPLGMVMMLFPDLSNFNGDRYSLTYQARQMVANTPCLVFSVASLEERDSGSFRGQIWVDSSSFNIVRIKGVFVGPYQRFFKALRGPERYFHFDSWREKTEQGWMPSTSYFDERHTYHVDGNLEFHYRGYVSLWQQPTRATPASPTASSRLNSNGGAAAFSSESGLIAKFEAEGLLAARGALEERLERLVRQLQLKDARQTATIHCRVLLTSPVEIFAVGNTIVLSRGLLNLSSDNSLLAYLLARQVAHISLGHTVLARSSTDSPFGEGENKISRVETHYKPEEEAAADFEARVLLAQSPYNDGMVRAEATLAQLAAGSGRFPNLVRARFGIGVTPDGSKFAVSKPRGSVESELHFEIRYRISWKGSIVDPQPQSIDTQLTSLENAVEGETSLAK